MNMKPLNNNTEKKPNHPPNKSDDTPTINDYRFLDYRLNQLENKIESGLGRIEEEQRQYNLQVLQTLQQLQDGQNKTYENIAKIKQRQKDMEEKLHCIDKLRDATSRNTERIKNNNQSTNHRVDVIQRILFVVGGAAISALFTAIIAIIEILL